MSDAPELKPCPFCGGKALLTNREMPGCAFVVCEGCQAQGDDGTVERVVAAWNRRADLHRAEVEAAVKRAIEACAGKAEKTGTCLMPNGQFLSERCAKNIRALATDPEALESILKGERK
jgi:Lar family restriction alleviation protein